MGNVFSWREMQYRKYQTKYNFLNTKGLDNKNLQKKKKKNASFKEFAETAILGRI